MVVSCDESGQEPEHESIVGHLQDPTREEENDDDDEAETLSLCDLPLYSDSAEWDKDGFSKVAAEPERSPRGASTGPLQDQEDLFEFSSSEDWSVSSWHHSGHVIFCGKLIPYGESPPVADNSGDLIRKRSPKSKKRRFFRWKLRLFRKSRTSYSYRKLRAGKKKRSKPLEVSDSKNLPLEKLGSLDGSGRKAGAKGRWYFLVFGSARFPMEMELSDMRMRQSRQQSPASMFQFADGAKKKYPRNWGLWRLLRTLSCSRSNNGERPASFVVKASPDELLHSNSRG